jgi:predicted SnoaL-like aldol condensation-catalyzing enzyme
MQDNLEVNKQNAIAFYRTAYLGNPAKAAELYVGAEYIQHNPQVGAGKQAFIDYFTEMAEQYPSKEIEFVRAVAEGDLVALHTHQTWPNNEEYVTMDFFRFDAMRTERLLSIGMPFKKFQLKQRTATPCIECSPDNALHRRSRTSAIGRYAFFQPDNVRTVAD